MMAQMLRPTLYYTDRQHSERGNLFSYKDRVSPRGYASSISFENALKWMSLVSSWGGVVDLPNLPHVPRSVVLHFIKQIMTEKSVNVIEIFRLILEHDAENLMKFNLSNKYPTPWDGSYFTEFYIDQTNLVVDNNNRLMHKDDVGSSNTPRMLQTIENDSTFSYDIYHNYLARDLILDRHGDAFKIIQQYFAGNVALDGVICDIFLNHNWSSDQTLVNIMNDLHNCKTLEEFHQNYVNKYMVYEFARTKLYLSGGSPSGVNLEHTTHLLEQTSKLILELLTFNSNTSVISILEVISCQLLHLILNVIIEFTENGGDDGATVSMICFHAIGMTFVDVITDRVTEELKHNCRNDLVKSITMMYRQQLTKCNLPLPSTVETIGRHQQQYNDTIQGLITKHSDCLDNTYMTFLQLYYLDRRVRSELKVVEFFTQMNSNKTMAKQIYVDLIKKMGEKVGEACRMAAHINEEYILYDHKFVEDILKNRELKKLIQGKYPQLNTLLDSL